MLSQVRSLDSPCLSLISIAVIKHYDQEQRGDKRVYFTDISTSQSILEGSQGRSLEAEAMEEVFFLAPHSFLTLLGYLFPIL